MTTKFKLAGYIRKAQVDNPFTSFFQESPKFMLELEPDGNHQFMFEELEYRTNKLKEQTPPDDAHLDSFKASPLFNNCSVCMETLHEPKRVGGLQWMNDDELIGKYVEVLGYIQQYKDGNCFLSFHYIETAPDLFLDFLDEDPDAPNDGGLF